MACSNLGAVEFVMPGYQRPDGAITVLFNGNLIDPYFATKALLTAQQAGMQTDRAAHDWIEWAISHQQEDGLFSRICINGAEYRRCATADADDAMLAVWIELLISISPAREMPRHWQRSLLKAHSYLKSSLYDRGQKIFLISTTNRVGLLMDNLEVYRALKSLGHYYSVLGDTGRAELLARQVNELRAGIMLQFWQPTLFQFRPSTQTLADSSFYPDHIAQLMPLLTGFDVPILRSSELYSSWMEMHKKAWFDQVSDDYPWGLIALVAAEVGDWRRVGCWLTHATPFRHGKHWNVLEEAVFQGLLSNPAARAKMGPANDCS